MAKTHLPIDFDYDFQLLAMVSPVKDYKLCWAINRACNYDLARKEDIEINSKLRKRLVHFSVYQFENELNKITYYVVMNKKDGEYLVPEVKEADYFLLLKGSQTQSEKERAIEAISSIGIVQTVFEVEPQSLKSKENLVFE